MKLKNTIHTYILEGKIEVSEFAKDIYEKTGIRLILEEPGQELHGYINAYTRTMENGKEYTVFDILYYDSDVDVSIDTKTHGPEHKLKRLFLTKKKTNLMKETVKRKHTFAEPEVVGAIINKLGVNIITDKNENISK